ncbi:hypothetical protein OAS19_01235 [Altererythrobacter sp.]|nr:hypothetical protein [Altererythrobacter sp.]
MFGADPIDLFDPAPYSALSYYAHIIIGILGLLAATVAFAARKGSPNHIRSGKVFAAAIVVVCLSSAAMLAVAFVPPLFLAAVTAGYLLATGWLALQPAIPLIKGSEYGLFVIEIAALAAFLSFGLAAAAAGQVPLFGPLSLTAIPIILLAGDLHWFIRPDQRRALRIRRHLARMIWLTIVVVRAPLVELAAGGVPIPAPLLVVGPVVVGGAVLWWSQRRFARLSPAG